MTTVIPFFIADLSVGQSADESDAETMSAFAPFVIAAWIAGICEAAVAAVPLVSVPFSPSCFRAASAPPDLTLSDTREVRVAEVLRDDEDLEALLQRLAEDEAIAIGTTARMSTSPRAVTTPETRLFIDVFICWILSTDVGITLTKEHDRTLSQPVHLPNHPPPSTAPALAGRSSAGPTAPFERPGLHLMSSGRHH